MRETTRIVKRHLARPAEPTKGPLLVAVNEVAIRKLYWEEVHRHDGLAIVYGMDVVPGVGKRVKPRHDREWYAEGNGGS